MDTGGPASNFRRRLYSTLKSAGMMHPMDNLLVGVIINTMALISAQPDTFILDPDTIRNILVLKNEIALLCDFYEINVIFRLLGMSAPMIRDAHSLRLNRSILVKLIPCKQKTLDDAQTLFNFLALVRYFLAELDSAELELLTADFHRKRLVHLPADAIRCPGAGPRLRRQVSSTSTIYETPQQSMHQESDQEPVPIVLNLNSQSTSSISGSGCNSNFISKPKPSESWIDLNEENCSLTLSDAPRRMSHKFRFGFKRPN
ncbi:unnamed protein product [Rhizoctonia solani]|uniref:Uncharacterized protein n=1 Tax=Rhizoctonia solani TaxID=456999 RepID=A0A8H3C035_9AGAM|nr:unnamed protein product [Rhizoctonia solani]